MIGVELSHADDFVYIMGTARDREREIDDANCTKERRFTLGHRLRLGFRVYGNP